MVRVLGLVALLTGADAQAEALRLRWHASPDPRVVTYRVYQRRLADPHARPRNLGPPSVNRDGTFEIEVPAVDLRVAYAFTVTSLSQGGLESPPSNEVVYQPQCERHDECADADVCTTDERCEAGACVQTPLACPPPSACETSHCDPIAGCGVTPLPDGSACFAGDPCLPGACAAGACREAENRSSSASHFLSVSFLNGRATRRRIRLVGKASYRVTQRFRPASTGLSIELLTEDGTTVRSIAIPGRALLVNRPRTRAVYRRTREADGGDLRIERLSLARDGETADLSITLTTETDERLTSKRLVWVVRVGSECVRDLAVDCVRSARGLVRCG